MLNDLKIIYGYGVDYKEVLDKLFSGKFLIELFPDIINIEPGTWSEHCHEIDVDDKNYPYINKIDVNIYREPLINGSSRTDDDENLDMDYAGRLTMEFFASDTGECIGACFDCGLPEKFKVKENEGVEK